jgi:hypothetical protein
MGNLGVQHFSLLLVPSLGSRRLLCTGSDGSNRVSILHLCCRVLRECDVQLCRQMGSVRDDLNIHEKALDILIELMKKEQVCSH